MRADKIHRPVESERKEKTSRTMSEDHYSTLGVPRDATPEAIHKAYRNLARKYHPDLNPDDETAKKKFQTIQQAYEVLKDPKKRELFDRYGSAYESMGGGPGGPRGGPWRTQGGQGQANPFEDVDLGEIFGQQFGEGGGGGFSDLFRQFTRKQPKKPSGAPRGQHIEHELTVSLHAAVAGGSAHITVRRPSGKVDTIDVKIPVGIEDGQKIRLRGLGDPAPPGGTPGDILITVRVAPHPSYQRQGRDLVVRAPVNLAEALWGAKIDIPTPKGKVTVTVPPYTSSGKRLRIKGHGVPFAENPGDLYVELQIVLPEQIDDATMDALKKLALQQPANPRAQLIW